VSAPPPEATTQAGLQNIFYNATLAPQLPRDVATPSKPVLQAGVKTILGFDIGPKRGESVISTPAPAEFIQSTEDIPLTIIFGCDFCPPTSQFERDITYRPKEGRSEWVQFEFTPEANHGGIGKEQLHLLVVNRKTGRPLDRMNIPVTVKADGATDVPAETMGLLAASRAPQPPAESVDIDVTIHAIAADGPRVTFSIEPQSPAMIKLLKPLAIDANGNRKRFRSGAVDSDLIDQTSTWSFGAMSAVSLQDKALTKLRATGADAIISDDSLESLILSSDEARRVSDTMAVAGQTLYRNFFHSGADKELAKIIALLEEASADSQVPLRVQIMTDRLSMPWQYLHPVGKKVDPNKFWGMRFSLSVLRSNDGGENWRESNEPRKPPKILFARYGTSSDSSVPLAEGQISALKAALPSMDVLSVYAGNDLIEHLKSDRNAITGFVTFMHASSGSQGAAPLLEFGDSDKVEGADFFNLKNREESADQDFRYLSLGPIAVLNACETGPAMKLTQPKLATALFQLGVKGVIVTEVSVWQTLGDDMAKRLMKHLVNGKTAADALTEARRELLAEKNNPLGLLYVYYGDPAAKLVIPSRETP
jgi:hypothetical protein